MESVYYIRQLISKSPYFFVIGNDDFSIWKEDPNGIYMDELIFHSSHIADIVEFLNRSE